MTLTGWLAASISMVMVSGAFYSTYRLLRTPMGSDLSEWISANDLGIIERDLPNLEEVIVVSHQVEKPGERLREAVIDNFKEGVKYTFIVSSGNFEEHKSTYSDYLTHY